MKERFEKLYWLINIILPVLGLFLLIDGYYDDESLYLFLIAVLMWIIRWIVTGKHIMESPFEFDISSNNTDDPWK